MKVPFVDLAPQHAEIRGELDRAVAGVIDSGRFIGGPELSAFEEELARYCSAGLSVGVSSGTDALLVALMALDVGPGDEVVTSPFTFFATAAVIARVGARPVFADIDPDSFNLDPAAAAAACSSKTKCLIPVNLYGRPAEIPATSAAVVEDAAQSIGACPVRGLASTLSFFPTKNLGAFGDGGAVLTDDEEFADRLRVLRSQGGRPKYFHKVVGGNFRLDALQAAVLRVKLRVLDERTEARRRNAQGYRQRFASAALPPEFRGPDADPQHIYNQFVVRAPRRDALREHLAERGVGTEIYYPRPLHLQEAFAHLGYRAGSLPHAETASGETLALPIGPSLTEEQQDFVVGEIERFYA